MSGEDGTDYLLWKEGPCITAAETATEERINERMGKVMNDRVEGVRRKNCRVGRMNNED